MRNFMLRLWSMTTVLLALWLGISGCSAVAEEATDAPNGEEVFDVRAYFTAQMARQDIVALQKTVQIGDKIEEQRVEDVDLSRELLLFKQSSIPKSQTGKYTRRVEGNVTTYLAQEKDLKVQSLAVTRAGDAVQRIEIETYVDSQVFEAAKSLVYEPARGYTVSTSQDVLLAGDQSTAIKAAFVLSE